MLVGRTVLASASTKSSRITRPSVPQPSTSFGQPRITPPVSPAAADASRTAVGLHGRMSDSSARRLLVVANRTESAPQLLEVVERRAHAGCEIKLMVPPERHPDAPDWTPEEAQELVQRAARGRPVELVDCGGDAAATIGTLV